MKLRHKILAVTTLLAVGYGLGSGNLTVESKNDKPAVTVQTVASTPKPEPIAIKVPVPDLPTKECTPDGGRGCWWDGGELKGKQPGYWVDRNGVVTYLNPKLNDTTKRRLWEAKQRKKDAESWGTVDGHRFCWAVIGDTSYVTCWDGYKTTS
ncbi:hypothetical protein [Streptomyces phage phiScoe45]|nr:hypothetical protein [Streptomyces phage phiScoe45]